MKTRLPKSRDPLEEQTQQAIAAAIAFPDHSALIPATFWLEWLRAILISQLDDREALVLWLLSWAYYSLNLTAEFEAWEWELSERTADLSRHLKVLPYPLIFGSADDLYWSQEAHSSLKHPVSRPKPKGTMHCKPKRCRTRKRQKQSTGRACVRLKGKGLSHLLFAVYCDRRQLPVLNQMVSDYQSHKALAEADKFSMGLFALRSAQLLWRKDKQQLAQKNHWQLLNLWMKWFSQMTKHSSPSEEQLEQWGRELFYLMLSTKLPWKTHRLYLHCTYDPRLLTAEGTEEVRQQKIADVRKRLAGLEQKNQSLEVERNNRQSLDPSVELETPEECMDNAEQAAKGQKNRQAAIKHLRTSLTRLENNLPPPRPSKPSNQGQPNIEVGVCFSMRKVVGVAAVDTGSQATLEYQSVRELLTNQQLDVLAERSRKIQEQHKGKQNQEKPKSQQEEAKKTTGKHRKVRRNKAKGRRTVMQLKLEEYRLINRWRKERDKNQTQRSEEQKQGLYTQSQAESHLAQHLNRLVAKRIVEFCRRWQASCIVIPDFGDLRESIECEIQAKARILFPGDNVELQKQYLKEVRMRAHRWNHKHLAQSIRSCAARHGIVVKTAHQAREGTMREKAVALCTTSRFVIPGGTAI